MGSEDANLGSFLDAIDDDPDWSSEDEESGLPKHLFTSAPASSSPPSNADKEKGKSLTFEDVFGSPIKKKSQPKAPAAPENFDGTFFAKLEGKPLTPPPSSSAKPLTNSAAPHRLLNGSSNSSDTVIDPHSRISLFRNSINLYTDSSTTVEAVLKDRNMGIPFVNLMSFTNWYRTSGKDQKKFWTSGVVTKKLSSTRTSGKGNEYTIWELSDLKDLTTSWSLFLFGGAASSPSLLAVPVGGFVDLVGPSVMDSKDGPLKFSVAKGDQIRHVGTGRYFGFCQGKRKDGKNCTAVVNIQECGFCIHHASGELRKLNFGQSKAKKQGGGAPKANGGGGGSFGPFPEERTPGTKTISFGAPPKGNQKQKPRMELQGGSQNMTRNSLRVGNHPSISFEQPKNPVLPKIKKPEEKEPLKLDPNKTKHLTDKDREILEALGAKDSNSDLPHLVAQNPTAGSRNYLQYLAQKQYQLDAKRAKSKEEMPGYGQSIGMNRQVLDSMKKALNYVRSKGTIPKANPNALPGNKKRKLVDSDQPGPSGSPSAPPSDQSDASKPKRAKANIEVEFDFESDEFKKILNAKSKHESLLEEVQQDEYFEKAVKKEALENKLLTTFTIDTTAVMCRQCKYVALGQSEYCKENRHQIKVVKATKRFFKCKNCGNRTMSLDRLPKHRKSSQIYSAFMYKITEQSPIPKCFFSVFQPVKIAKVRVGWQPQWAKKRRDLNSHPKFYP